MRYKLQFNTSPSRTLDNGEFKSPKRPAIRSKVELRNVRRKNCVLHFWEVIEKNWELSPPRMFHSEVLETCKSKSVHGHALCSMFVLCLYSFWGCHTFEWTVRYPEFVNIVWIGMSLRMSITRIVQVSHCKFFNETNFALTNGSSNAFASDFSKIYQKTSHHHGFAIRFKSYI